MQPLFQREVMFSPPHTLRRAVLAVAVAVGVGAIAFQLTGPRILCGFSNSKTDLATMTTKKYALEAYPSWAAAHPDRECPVSLRELDPYMGSVPSHDPWGGDYHLACGRHMTPKGVVGAWILSAGEDRQFGTADDIRSDQ